MGKQAFDFAGSLRPGIGRIWYYDRALKGFALCGYISDGADQAYICLGTVIRTIFCIFYNASEQIRALPVRV
jgi:hypothetical protein